MFNLDQIMHFFTNNITNIITISSPVILIIKYFLIVDIRVNVNKNMESQKNYLKLIFGTIF